MLRIRRTTFAVAACLGLLAAACGGSDAADDAGDSTTTVATSTTAPEVAADTTTTTAIATTTGVDAETTTTEANPETTTTEATSTTIRDTGPAPLRLAPLSKELDPVISFTADGIIPFGHGGPGELIPHEGISELASIPGWGIVFQTIGNPNVIWAITDGEPDGMLVAPDDDHITLEGGGLDDDGEPIVLYQYHQWGPPETNVTTLRSFRPTDGRVLDIAVTGGWEWGMSTNALHVLGPGNGDTAVARWGSEGWEGLDVLDVQTGDLVFSSSTDLGQECFSGDVGCPDYWAAVPFFGDIIGIGPVWNDEAGWVDAFGLWEYSTATGEQSLMQSWEWDNGLWYPEDMFVINDSTLVVSLGTGPDGGGDPLPALFFDLVSGESWTAPTAAWVRPTTLS